MPRERRIELPQIVCCLAQLSYVHLVIPNIASLRTVVILAVAMTPASHRGGHWEIFAAS
jgi:hypothetical protein